MLNQKEILYEIPIIMKLLFKLYKILPSSKVVSLVRYEIGDNNIPSTTIRKFLREPEYSLTDKGWIRNTDYDSCGN